MTTTPDPARQADLLRFARDVYARPGIQALCLRLQDEHDVDVVLLLTCCWYGCYYGTLKDTQFKQATAFCHRWRAQLVQPLRQARRWLKPHPADTMGIPGADQEALRERIKALELETEFMQLRALAGCLNKPASGTDTSAHRAALPADVDAMAAIRANLALYAREYKLETGQVEARHEGLDDQAVLLLARASLAL